VKCPRARLGTRPGHRLVDAVRLPGRDRQVGGSIGTSLLNTVTASAAAGYVTSRLSSGLLVDGRPTPALVQLARVHSYTVAFWWAAALFAIGAVLAAALFRRAE
jgi:hypothetical protein